MGLAPGIKLGPYEILAPLGAGGMGEVYRARDTKLNREVALKVVPQSFASDRERLARFEREAQVLASLNHPNIAAIYGLEESGGVEALVMELVEGKTLAERLHGVPGFSRPHTDVSPRSDLKVATTVGGRHGVPLPLEEALVLAKQIAEALEAADERGIVHRDLKPANIKITPAGTVKVLDFGLAKAFEVRDSSANVANSPTLSVAATAAGVILGTAAYISPEQARGKPADRRADIWAFGCVLCEMLTGRQTFQGETVSDILAGVLMKEPEWAALPPETPIRIRQLLGRCLEKDAKRRLQAIGEARIVIEETLSGKSDAGADLVPAFMPAGTGTTPGRPQEVPRRGTRAGGLALGGLLAIAAAFLAGLWYSAERTSTNEKWSGTLLAGPGVAIGPRISPDGRTLAFQDYVGNLTQVAVMNALSADWTVLTKDRSQGTVWNICWSRDGAKIYYDRILDTPRGIFTVSALGGEERLVLEDAMSPEVLPDNSILVTRINPDRNLQLFHYWPETGKLQPLPALPQPTAGTGAPIRAFPDGKDAVFLGRSPEQPPSDSVPHLYKINLESNQVSRLAPEGSSQVLNFGSRVPLGVDAEGKFVIVGVRSGDLNQLVEIPRDGKAAPRTFLFLTQLPWFIDLGPDGSLFVDQPSRPLEILRFPASGGNPEVLASWPVDPGMQGPILLPDGRGILPVNFAGRSRLMIATPRADPTPFIQTNDETRPPLALIGGDKIAFIDGSASDSSIAIASLSDGRIIRRLKGAKGNNFAGLTSSPDGKTLYFAASGSIWSVPAADGEVHKMGPGDSVAADPNGRGLIVELFEKGGVRLARMPIMGGSSLPIALQSDLRLAPVPLAALAAGKDGRVVVTAAVKDSWFYTAAIVDPAKGKIEKVPLDFTGDVTNPQWTKDGRISATGCPTRSSLWRFRPESSTGH